jgi:DUF971 family protein
MKNTRLENVAVVGDSLAISYVDGREDYLLLEFLRKFCPCAVCQGEPDVMGRVLLPSKTYNPGAFDLLKVELVGGYALQLFWKDGHSTGIYSFDYLKRIPQVPKD